MKKQFPTQFMEHVSISDFIGSYQISAFLNQTSDILSCWQLFYVFHGTWSGIVDGKQTNISKNEMYLFRPGCLRVTMRDENADVEFGIISFLSDSPTLQKISNTAFPAKPEEKQLFKSIQLLTVNNFEIITDSDIFRGLRPKSTASGIALQRMKNSIESLLLSLLSHLDIDNNGDVKCNTLNRDIKIVCEIESYMMEHLGEQLSVEDIAKHTFLSVSKIKRAFKSVTGHGALQHFTTLKIHRAVELIQNDEHNFSEIADMLGFESLSYFSQIFKQKTGYTPSAFSKLQR